MDFIQSLKISGTGLSANRTKMNVIAENLANVDTTRTEDGGPYRRKMVVYEGKQLKDFKSTLEQEKKDAQNSGIDEKKFDESLKIKFSSGKPKETYTGVEVTDIVQSQEDFILVYNPAHPDADPLTGYVAMPNVDHLTEIADMMVAKRAYDANVTALSNTKGMIMKALEIGK
ncbi:MAG: flagellar basal body rod protein FlgC [Desulfobacteraceae bacterium 4572_19]|nr:MAG: flagellar basal body rod protein FlgC [Desulfobacteraceae bacterium 4572_19]